MSTEKRVIQGLLLLLFGWCALYATALHSSAYDSKGVPRNQEDSFRIVGEDLAGDYAAFRLLEEKSDRAYDPERQSAYIAEQTGVKRFFSSVGSPVASFLFVPFLQMSYPQFYESLLQSGIFFFSVAMYSIFPLIGAILLTAALPAIYLNASFGTFGLFVASSAVLLFALAENRPKTAGLLGAVTTFCPVLFLSAAAVLFFRRRKKALFSLLTTGGLLLFAACSRYGVAVFGDVLKNASLTLKEIPCRFQSVVGLSACSGGNFAFSVVFQAIIAALVIYGAVVLFRRRIVSEDVQNAYVCAAFLFVTPFAEFGDYALFAAAAAFLLRDCEKRGYGKPEVLFFLLTGAGILLNPVAGTLTGAPLFFFLNGAALLICMRRSV